MCVIFFKMFPGPQGWNELKKRDEQEWFFCFGELP